VRAVVTPHQTARASFGCPWHPYATQSMLDSMNRPGPPVRKTLQHYDEPGHAHALTFSCSQRLPLLSRDRTRRWFVEALNQARQRHEFDVWAFVIMPEHAHVVIMPRRPSYSTASVLKSIKQSVARRATNWLREHSVEWLGRLVVTRPSGRTEFRFWLQGGGYDRNIIEARAAWGSVEYIHDNPVRRGLVATPTDWFWSSARHYAGIEPCAEIVITRPPDVT